MAPLRAAGWFKVDLWVGLLGQAVGDDIGGHCGPNAADDSGLLLSGHWELRTAYNVIYQIDGIKYLIRFPVPSSHLC